jgi:hypothetical protein
MAKDYSSLIAIAGVGALAWYGYEQGWFSSLLAAVTPAPTPTAGNAPSSAINCPAPSVLVNGVCTAPTVTQGTNPPVAITTPPAPSASGLSTAGSLAALSLAAQAASEGLPNAGTATLNADQWNYYYGHVPAFLPSVSGGAVNPGFLIPNLDAIFFPNGRPANTSNYTQYTAGQFIAALQNAGLNWSGLSGLGDYYGIPVSAIHQGRYA